jgi:hypothetical protein
MRLFDSDDRTLDLHLVSSAVAFAVFIVMTCWMVWARGKDFDPQTYGVGALALLGGGGMAAAGAGLGRRAQGPPA